MRLKDIPNYKIITHKIQAHVAIEPNSPYVAQRIQWAFEVYPISPTKNPTQIQTTTSVFPPRIAIQRPPHLALNTSTVRLEDLSRIATWHHLTPLFLSLSLSAYSPLP